MATPNRTDDRTTAAAPAKQSDRTVHLSPEAYESLFVAALRQTAISLSTAQDYFEQLADAADHGAHAGDAQLSVKILRGDLRALDQLGWPHWGSDEPSAA